ncbi:MAG: ATP-binding protein [Candidatus Paceibacterota bacterium]
MSFSGKYIITGPPGSGKSSLIGHLADLGYRCEPEVAREVAKDIKSRKSPAFNRSVIERGREMFWGAPADQVSFFDRGVPDTVAYARWGGDPDADEYEEIARMCKYDNPVFFLPYWKAIYANDAVRDEFQSDARAIERHLFEVYRELGYTIFTLPRDSVEERAGLILSIISGHTD